MDLSEAAVAYFGWHARVSSGFIVSVYEDYLFGFVEVSDVTTAVDAPREVASASAMPRSSGNKCKVERYTSYVALVYIDS